MNAKENRGLQAPGFKEGRFAPTSEQSHTEHPNASEKPAQAQQTEPREGTKLALALDLLRHRGRDFVGLDELMKHARLGATHSAISTLRRRYGFQIENRMSRSKEGVTLSEYRLKGEES